MNESEQLISALRDYQLIVTIQEEQIERLKNIIKDLKEQIAKQATTIRDEEWK